MNEYIFDTFCKEFDKKLWEKQVKRTAKRCKHAIKRSLRSENPYSKRSKTDHKHHLIAPNMSHKTTQTLLPTSNILKYSNSCRLTDHSSVDFSRLADLYVDYCLGSYEQIHRGFVLIHRNDYDQFPVYAAQKFAQMVWRTCKHKITPQETRLMAEVAQKIATDYSELLLIYQNDDEFLEVLERPYAFLRLLAWNYPAPPQDPWHLQHALRAAEMGMLVLGV